MGPGRHPAVPERLAIFSPPGERVVTLPNWREWLFSAKAFGAAMLAFYIAVCLDLPKPYWAMTTVYVVSHPLSGATRSKALYRVCGTLLGAIAAVALVPNLVNAPELLSLGMALWVGICLYFSLLDRTPRSYVFMLAGYTAPIIGFASVSDPGAIFDTALARVEEITLAILCASLVASIVFPQSVAALVAARLTRWRNDADASAADVLAGHATGLTMRADQRRLAADAVEIDMLSTHLAFEPGLSRDTVHWVRMLRLRLLMLLPILSSVADRLRALRLRDGTLPSGLQPVLDDLQAWLRAGPDNLPEDADRLRRSITALAPGLNKRSRWQDIMLSSLLIGLRELVDIRQDCRDLQRFGEHEDASRLPRLAFRTDATAVEARHVDHGMAFLSASAAFVAVLIGCAFWITAAWPEGASLPTMAAVACSIFATQDDPVPGIMQFVRWCGAALLIFAIYVLAILPSVQEFEMLSLVLLPVFLIFGAVAARPATLLVGLAVAANGPSLMALENRYAANFLSYANSGLALVGGLWLGALVTGVARSVSADWGTQRLLRAGWDSLADAAERRGKRDRARFAGIMLDRIGLLAPRLATMAPDRNEAALDLLAELRVGLNIVDLRRSRRALPPRVVAEIDRMLDGLAAHFRACTRRRAPVPPTPTLLMQIDRALSAVSAVPDGPHKRDPLLGLVGIRRGLFPEAPPYEPSTALAHPSTAAAAA
jgi:uncharacterized membrane protein YccC